MRRRVTCGHLLVVPVHHGAFRHEYGASGTLRTDLWGLFLKSINYLQFCSRGVEVVLALDAPSIAVFECPGTVWLGLASVDSGGLVQTALDQPAVTQAMRCLGTGQHGQVQQRFEDDDGHVGTAEGQD